MYLKRVKTVFATHISHTYKKGAASLHVPGWGCGPGLLSEPARAAPQRRGAEPHQELRAQPRAREPGLSCHSLKAPVQARGLCQGAPLCPDIQARAAGAAKKQRAKKPRMLPPLC